jgi:predicted Zn-dependent protease
VQITTTSFSDPAQALQKFNTQQGVTPVGAPGRASTTLPSVAQQFTARTDEGELAGAAAFVSHQGHVYQILELTTPERLVGYAPSFMEVPASFAELTDPAALAVRAARLQVFTVPRPMTLAQLAQERPASVPVETLALINQVQPSATLAAGQKVKWVVGGTKEQPVSMAP